VIAHITDAYGPWWGILAAFLVGALAWSVGEVLTAWAKRIERGGK
jgi:hypothetical protein